jgi:hypothetical protein
MANTPESKDVAASAPSFLHVWLAWLPTVIAGAAGALWLYLAGWIAPESQEWKAPAKIILQAGGLLVLILLYLSGLCVHFWLRSRTKIAFGLMWDSRRNPICAKCHGPLSKDFGHRMACPACAVSYPVYDDLRGEVFVWDVLSTVRNHGLKSKLVKGKQ